MQCTRRQHSRTETEKNRIITRYEDRNNKQYNNNTPNEKKPTIPIKVIVFLWYTYNKIDCQNSYYRTVCLSHIIACITTFYSTMESSVVNNNDKNNSNEEEDEFLDRNEVIKMQWKDQEDGRLVLKCLEYLDVVTLIQKKSVSKQWQQLGTKAIDDKCIERKKKKSFQFKQELHDAVDKYAGTPSNEFRPCTPKDAEEIASSYGYPIDKWDVSNIKDFSRLFMNRSAFNEPIRSWDVSNATQLNVMFYRASSFNQDTSAWDVSSVTNMSFMFYSAESFNQNISSWNVSKATNMEFMFTDASSFNQDISSWNVSNVTTMYSMFVNAHFFNQDIAPWDVTKVLDMRYMFSRALSFNQDISSWDVNDGSKIHGMFLDCLLDARQLPWFTEDMIP